MMKDLPIISIIFPICLYSLLCPQLIEVYLKSQQSLFPSGQLMNRNFPMEISFQVALVSSGTVLKPERIRTYYHFSFYRDV